MMIHRITDVNDPKYIYHIEEIIALIRELRVISYENNVKSGFIWAAWDAELAMTNAEIREQLEEGLIENTSELQIVIISDKVIGFANLHYGGDTMTIGLLCVASPCRGLGVGDKLMENILSVAKESSCLQIIVSTETVNKPAMTLYQKFGLVSFTVELGLRL